MAVFKLLKVISVMVILRTHTIVSATKLQCYQCDDCHGNEVLVTCALDSIVTTKQPAAIGSTYDEKKSSIIVENRMQNDLATIKEKVVINAAPSLITVPNTEIYQSTTDQPQTTFPHTTYADTTFPDRTFPITTGTPPTLSSTTSTTGDISFACYILFIKDDSGKSITRKGCVSKGTTQSACGAAESQVSSGTIERCIPCLNSKCNSSAAIQLSMSVVIALFVELCAL